MFNRALRLLADLPFADSQCGLKGFRRLAARELFHEARLDWFAFDVEVLLARRLGLAVAEVPVEAEVRGGSKVGVGLDGQRLLGEVGRCAEDSTSPEHHGV